MNTEILLISIFLGCISIGSGFYVEREDIKNQHKISLLYFHTLVTFLAAGMFSYYIFQTREGIIEIIYLFLLLMASGSICLRILSKYGSRPVHQSLAIELLLFSQHIGTLLLIFSGLIVFVLGWLIGLNHLRVFSASKQYRKIMHLYMLF